jgi:hypothetical protein
LSALFHSVVYLNSLISFRCSFLSTLILLRCSYVYSFVLFNFIDHS